MLGRFLRWRRDPGAAAIDRPAALLPYRVVIETLSYCNGACTFCPANKTTDTRGKNVMPMAMVEKILADLASVSYAGVVSLHGNSEPLLNPAIVEIVAKARAALPDAFISIWTNGTKLDWARHEDLFPAGLNHLHINNYSHKRTVHKPVRAFLDAFRASPWAADPRVVVELYMREVDEVLMNKGGLAPNKPAGEGFEPIAGACFSPVSDMQINYKGDLFSCCFDDYYRSTFGNVADGLWQAWNSEPYRRFRREVAAQGDRTRYPACAQCDVPHNKPERVLTKRTRTGDAYIVQPGVFGETELERSYSSGAA
jgi:radical SAM protein with 4Fe4S-binding SPASM domain